MNPWMTMSKLRHIMPAGTWSLQLGVDGALTLGWPTTMRRMMMMMKLMPHKANKPLRLGRDLGFGFGRCGFGPVLGLLALTSLYIFALCVRKMPILEQVQPICELRAPQCLCLVLSWPREQCVCVKNCPSRQAQQAITATLGRARTIKAFC